MERNNNVVIYSFIVSLLLATAVTISVFWYAEKTSDKLNFISANVVTDTLYVKEIFYIADANGKAITKETWKDIDLDVCPEAFILCDSIIQILPKLSNGLQLKSKLIPLGGDK